MQHNHANSPASSRPPPAPGILTRMAMPLSIAVTLLLFLQWPLRELVGAWSTDANDMAQWVFALYVAVALRHAGERGAHLVARPDLVHAAGFGARLRRICAPLCVLPWALFVIVAGAPQVWRSVASLERFPDTFNAGYFMIKLALLLLAALLLLQAAQGLWRAWCHPAQAEEEAPWAGSD